MPHPASSITSATLFFRAVAAEQATNHSPLPHVVEKWVTYPNGRCRLVWCQSIYGSHWEVGSTQSGTVQPTFVLSGEMIEDARQVLLRFLETKLV